jgi:hypothetical protein
MKHAPCATRLLAFVDRFLLRLSLVCRISPTREIPVGGECSALLVESRPQNTGLAALGTIIQGLFLRARPVWFAL